MVSIYLLVLYVGVFMSKLSLESEVLTEPFDTANVQQQVIINTRPLERAAPLTTHLQAAGLKVVEMPMLALQPRSITTTDLNMMRQWMAGDYQALVVVSPTAASLGLEALQGLREEIDSDCLNTTVISEQQDKHSLFYSPKTIIAVGSATASVLIQASQDLDLKLQVLQPQIANNEGMLAMPDIGNLQSGDRLLIWRGLGGRRLLVDTLQSRGVYIDSIAWYERMMPDDALQQYQQWWQAFSQQDFLPHRALGLLPPIVIISSGTAFEHWSSIVNALSSTTGLPLKPDLKTKASAQLSDFTYIVLGERLATMVAEQQLKYWRVEDLEPETILATIQDNTF